MINYKDMHTPAELDDAKATYEMLLMFEAANDYEGVASYIAWVMNERPELYADVVLLDIMRGAHNGRT